MRQLVQDLRSGTVEVLEVPDPQPGRGQLLIRTRWSVISPGTEQTITETASKSLVGKALDRPDQVRKVLEKTLSEGPGSALAAVRARLDDLLTPGYSSMGVVEAVGPGVEGFAPGDRVGAVGANFACHAELAVVPAPLCLRLPDGIDDRAGSFGAIGAIAAHGLRVGEVQAGHVVAVVGLGLIGQLAAQLATAAGARVVAIDLDPARVELARTLGAVGGAPGDAAAARAAVDAASDGAGADVVVIAAGTKEAGPLELAAELAADRAVVSVIGDVPIEAPRTPYYLKELQVRLSRSYGPGRYDPAYEQDGHDYPRGFVRWTERRLIGYVFEEIARGRVTIEPLVSHEFELGDGAQAYEALGEPGRMAILLRHPVPDTAATPAPGPRRVTLGTPNGAAPAGGKPRIGLIGPGLFARSTLIPVLERAGADLVAVGGRAGARAVGVARRSGAQWTTADPEEVIADPEIDAVVIATRHDTHASLAARALAAGKAVLVEKPLAVDADALAELEPHLMGDARLVVDFNRSCAPATRRVQHLFAGRGEPVNVHVRVNAGTLPADHWLRDRAAGGGRAVGEGCHFVDLCSALVGSPVRSVQVRAPGAGGPHTLPGDTFSATLAYADGSLAVIDYVAGGHAGMGKERVEVMGAGRAATIDDWRRVRLYGGARALRPNRPALGQDKGHDALVGAALTFFARGGAPPIPLERALETTRVTFAIRDLLDGGVQAPVALPG